jgi:4-amino-4-deoxy-L-arabinose transferase-like glycosyltransferase
MKKYLKFILPLLVFIIPFGVYTFTLAPSITAGDSTEMINASLVLGIPHQPSYPLNTILGHLFSLIPLGPNPTWRVNLMSAFFEALTCVLIYLIIIKLYQNHRRIKSVKKSTKNIKFSNYLLASSASLFLAFSLTFWQYGTKAEVFALNNFLICAVILTFLTAVEKQGKKRFWLGSFLAGLAFTHHQTAIIIAPALLYLIVKTRKKLLLTKSFWIISVIFTLPSFYLYYLILTRLARLDPPLNWGNPVDLKGVLDALMRTDYGTFSAYLVGFGERSTTAPIDQIFFYFHSLLNDFTIIGVILAVIGAIYLFRFSKDTFFFSFIGFASGAFFLSYANFPLHDAFNQATTKRFQLLPNLFFLLFIAFGLWFVWQKFTQSMLKKKEAINVFTNSVVFLSFCLIFFIPLIFNFSKANNRQSTLAIEYATDFYPTTEPNAIILLSGDVSNFAAHYVKTVILKNDNRIVFTPGQFHLKWFTKQLKSRYPDLIIPPPEEGKRWTTTSQIIRANLDRRPVYISPELAVYDPEVEKEFVLWPHNTLFKARKKGGEENLEGYQESTQKLWESLDLTSFSQIRKKNPVMDAVIINYYARHFHNLGYMYDSVELYDDAIREYKRALEIDPYLGDSMKSLGLIYGMKLETKDYQKSIEYLSRFAALVDKSNPELADSARYTISKILEDQAEEIKKFEEQIATMSAEVKQKEELSEDQEATKEAE